MKSNAGQPQASESEPGSKPDANGDLKSLPLPEVEKKLGSSSDGLSQAEAKKRLTQYGPNEIEEKKTNAFLKFLSYFWGPIPWMIEAAVILSAVDRHWPDFGIILTLLLANAVVGFWEEHQAGNAIAALKAKLAIKTQVKRGGFKSEVQRPWLMNGGGSCVGIGQHLRKHLQRRTEFMRRARSAVEAVGDGIQVRLGVHRQVSALGQILAQQSVGVLAGATLPGAVRITEVHSHTGAGGEFGMARHLPALVVVMLWRTGAAMDCSLAVKPARADGAVASGICTSNSRRLERSTSTPTADLLPAPLTCLLAARTGR